MLPGKFDKLVLTASAARLWSLIEERTRPDADVDKIDETIWELFGEDWAIVFTDLAGFSRQTAKFGVTHFLQVIFEQSALLLPVIEAHNGFVVKVEADSLLVLFRTPEAAVECCIAMQRACTKTNERRVEEEQILLCAGIGWGRVLRVGETDVFGREVNAASKLGEDTAKAYEILATESVCKAVGDKPGAKFEALGEAVPGSKTNYRINY